MVINNQVIFELISNGDHQIKISETPYAFNVRKLYTLEEMDRFYKGGVIDDGGKDEMRDGGNTSK